MVAGDAAVSSTYGPNGSSSSSSAKVFCGILLGDRVKDAVVVVEDVERGTCGEPVGCINGQPLQLGYSNTRLLLQVRASG